MLLHLDWPEHVELLNARTINSDRLSLCGNVPEADADDVAHALSRMPRLRSLSLSDMRLAPCDRLAWPHSLYLENVGAFPGSLLKHVVMLYIQGRTFPMGGWDAALADARRLVRLEMDVLDERTLRDVCAARPGPILSVDLAIQGVPASAGNLAALVRAHFPVDFTRGRVIWGVVFPRRAMLAFLCALSGPAGRFVDRDGGFGAHAAGPLTTRVSDFLF